VATPVDQYREKPQRVRVLFALGTTPDFFSLEDSAIPDVMEACKQAFNDLETKFDVHVLGTLDDDETMVGPSASWPWTCYILADAPNRDAVAGVCNQLRTTKVGESGPRLWRYLQIEARLGRPLFFGES
jgi:hypothetical protein